MSEAEFDDMLDAISAEIGFDPQAAFPGRFSSLGPLPSSANDNDLVWPMIPFPDGWCASS